MFTACLANGRRQTATLNYEMATMPERSQGRSLKRFLDCYWDWNRSQDLKTCKLCGGDGGDDDDDDDGDGDNEEKEAEKEVKNSVFFKYIYLRCLRIL
jgi:hypothetical protein